MDEIRITGPLARDMELRNAAAELAEGNPYHDKSDGRFTTGNRGPAPQRGSFPNQKKFQQAQNKYDFGARGKMPASRGVSNWNGTPGWQARGQTALSLIDGVHSLPAGFPTVEMLGSQGGFTLSMDGKFKYDTDAAGKKVPNSIFYDEFDGDAESTCTHEFGHFVDSQLGLSKDAELLKALNNSPTVKNMKKALSKAQADAKNGKLSADARDIAGQTANYIRYQLDPAEMTARAYAQYIGRKAKGKNPIVDKQVKTTLKDKNPLERSNQWSDKEFGRISQSFDQAFRKRKLLK